MNGTLGAVLLKGSPDHRPAGGLDQAGELVEETSFTLFVRGEGRKDEKGAAAQPPRKDATPAPLAEIAQQLDPDQTFRYAEASGDRTKIHLDAEAARRAGLPGIIGHGLCTMAFVSKVLVDELAGGDPTRLARMSLRFAQPVIPGEKIETTIRTTDRPDRFSFETVDPRGAPVVSQGIAEIRAEA